VVLCLCAAVAVTVVDAAPAADARRRFDWSDATFDLSDQWESPYPFPMPEIPYPNPYPRPRPPTYPRVPVPEIPQNNRLP